MPRPHVCATPGCPTIIHTATSYCPTHRRDSPTTQQRTKAERNRRAATVATWVAEHGWQCPGWQRPPHPSRDLTADHVTPVANGGIDGPLRVLCRACNSSRGARGG